MIMRKDDFSKKKTPLNVSEAQYLLEAVMRFKKEIENVPEPNEGRIQELKESIKKGTLITDEVLNEVAAKIAHILLNPREEENNS